MAHVLAALLAVATQHASVAAHNATAQPLPSNATDDLQGSLAATAAKGVVFALIIVGAVFGNSLVIISVLKFERLRSRTNIFIVSLAFADLFVGLGAMTFNASMELSGRWFFGRVMCDIFNSNDVLFSTASILHLCAISVDRYLAITQPYHYRRIISRRRVYITIVVIWLASTLLSHMPIHLQFYTTEEHRQFLLEQPYVCDFQVTPVYAVVSSTISFWLPSCVMVFTYARLFRLAKQQEERLFSEKERLRSVAAAASLSDTKRQEAETTLLAVPVARRNDVSTERRHAKKMHREHKAAKTLGCVMGCFLLCWLPFFLWYLITNLCGAACSYPDFLVSLLFWIGYVNSTLNPLIYAALNGSFRSAFATLLHCPKADPLKESSIKRLSAVVRGRPSVKRVTANSRLHGAMPPTDDRFRYRRETAMETLDRTPDDMSNVPDTEQAAASVHNGNARSWAVTQRAPSPGCPAEQREASQPSRATLKRPSALQPLHHLADGSVDSLPAAVGTPRLAAYRNSVTDSMDDLSSTSETNSAAEHAAHVWRARVKDSPHLQPTKSVLGRLRSAVLQMNRARQVTTPLATTPPPDPPPDAPVTPPSPNHLSCQPPLVMPSQTLLLAALRRAQTTHDRSTKHAQTRRFSEDQMRQIAFELPSTEV